jgi:hypothetical protein
LLYVRKPFVPWELSSLSILTFSPWWVIESDQASPAHEQPFVKVALEDRLSDNSPAVRDIAVDLVGKYIVQKPSLATEYYRHIADRINVSEVIYLIRNKLM